MVQNRLENWGLNPMTFVDVTNLVSILKAMRCYKGVLIARMRMGVITIISLLRKYYCGCIVEAAL